MANVIKHKRGSGSDPVANDLVVGEVAIRTDVGKLFTKMDNGSVAEIAGGGSDIAINTLSSSSGTGGGSATFNGSAYRFTLSAPPSVSAQQLLVSINGVIQKPVAGTGQPSEGFSVDGTDIILGDAPATGSDFFILTFKSLGVSEPADNSVTSAKIVDGAIVNADINASAAIAGSKISPDFGSQNIVTTGQVRPSSINITDNAPQIALVDTDANSDFRIKVDGGNFQIEDITNGGGDRFVIASDSTVTIEGNLDVGAGIDVTGAITATGNLAMGESLTLTGGVPHVNFIDDGANPDWQIGNINGILRFQDTTAGAERMRIDSSGRLLVGTTQTLSKLTVDTDLGVIRSSSDPTINLLLGTTSSITQLYRILIDDSDGDKLQVRDDDTPRITLDGSGNVGIGVTDVKAALQVNSSKNAETDRHDASNYHLFLRNPADDTGEACGLAFSVTSNVTKTGAAIMHEREGGGSLGGLQFYTNGDGNSVTERLRIDGSGIVYVGGVGASATAGTLFFNDTSAHGSKIAQVNGSSALTFHTGASQPERMRIDSSGRLLLGTTTARDNLANNTSGVAAQLQLEGTSGTKSLMSIVRNTNDASDGGIVIGKSRGTSVGSTTAVQAGDDLGHITFAGADGTTLQFGAEIKGEVQSGVGNDDMPTALLFSTNGGSTNMVERMRIDQSGKVGIGTTSPNKLLHIQDAAISGYGSQSSTLLVVEDSGDTSIEIASGFNNTGSIFFGDTGASNKGQINYLHGSGGDAMSFHANGSERMRIDSSGQLTSTASNNGQIIHKYKNTDATGSSSSMTVEQHFNFNRTGGGLDLSAARIIAGKEREWVGAASNQDGFLAFHTCLNETPTERMRISSSGVRFGATAAIQSEKYTFFRPESEGNTLAYFHEGASADVTGVIFRHGRALSGFNGKQIGFLRNDGTEVGSIVSGINSTGYNTSSDYRLKENVTAISDGITRLKTLKPYKFNFKDDTTKLVVDGFFAHEVSSVVPIAVTGTKDQVDSDNNPVYQGIDQSKLVPLLVAAVQELIGKVEALEAA